MDVPGQSETDNPPFSSYGEDEASGARSESNFNYGGTAESTGAGQDEVSETNLATNPNGGKAASGPRVKADKDGVNAAGVNKRRS